MKIVIVILILAAAIFGGIVLYVWHTEIPAHKILAPLGDCICTEDIQKLCKYEDGAVVYAKYVPSFCSCDRDANDLKRKGYTYCN